MKKLVIALALAMAIVPMTFAQATPAAPTTTKTKKVKKAKTPKKPKAKKGEPKGAN